MGKHKIMIEINLDEDAFNHLEAVAKATKRSIESVVIHGACGYARRYNKVFKLWGRNVK